MVFLLVNTTSPNAQYFIPGGDPPGNFCLIFLFFIYKFFSVYYDFVTKIEDCASNGNELLSLLAINILLSLANLIVNGIVALRCKRPCKKSTNYDLHMELQRTAPQDMGSQEANPQGTEPQGAALQDMGSQGAVPEVIKFMLIFSWACIIFLKICHIVIHRKY